MIKLSDAAPSRQAIPNWQYTRMEIVAAQQTVLYQIPIGYAYMLERVLSKWPDRDANPPTIAIPQVLVELTEVVRERSRQNVAYRLRLISTPAEPGVVVSAAPSPVDLDNFGVEFTATPVKKQEPVGGIIFAYGSNVELKVTGQQFVAGTWRPQYVDIVLVGYSIPEKSLIMWGENE